MTEDKIADSVTRDLKSTEEEDEDYNSEPRLNMGQVKDHLNLTFLKSSSGMDCVKKMPCMTTFHSYYTDVYKRQLPGFFVCL